MLIKLYPIKRTLAVYIVILFLTLFLSIIPTFAQQSDDPLEKQLKVFQLSNLFDIQSNFPQQDAYFKNALQYFQNKHYSFAIQELEKIGYSHLYIPLYLKSQLLKGKCYETLNRWESALYIYEKIIEDVPIMRDYVLFLLGKIYLHMNDFSNAMIIFQRLKNEYPGSSLISQATYQIALIYLKDNHVDRFLNESQSAIQSSLEESFKAQILLKISDVLWEKGMFNESLAYLKELIGKRYHRENIVRYENLYVKRFQILHQDEQVNIKPELLFFCAEILFNYRQYEMAEMLYQEAMNRFPDQIDLGPTHYSLARAIYSQGEYERAIEQCLYIIENFNEPNLKAQASYLYACALMSLAHYHQAIEQFQKVINQYPESYFAGSSYLHIAEIESLRNHEENSINVLRQLIDKYPQSDQAGEASWMLALYFNNKHENQKARHFYQLIVDRFPQSGSADEALYWLGKLQFFQDRIEGMNWYRILLEEFPDSYYSFRVPVEVITESPYSIQQIINSSKEYSLDHFRKEHFPQNLLAQLATYKAELLRDIGFYQESILEIRNCLQIEPENTYLMYLLSETYSQNGQYYLSITWAQTLLNHFLERPVLEKISFRLWELAFPRYYGDIVEKLASDYALDPYLIWSTIREESHFNPASESKAGARGLMQVILSTGDWIAQKLGYQEFNEDSLFTAEVNIRFGAWYLNYLDEKFNQNHYLIISGYNAGPGVTERWMQSMDMSDIDYFIENIPYPETSEHIKKVNRTWNLYRLIYGK